MPFWSDCLVCGTPGSSPHRARPRLYCSPECEIEGRRRNRPTARERFYRVVAVGPGCWLWPGATDNNGYGLFSMAGTRSAHRASWILHNGPIGPGLEVCHRCDVPGCVNPAHLFLGTHADNMADSASKGRATAPRGTASPRAKLTDSKVIQMRAAFEAGARIADLARQYGVSEMGVRNVVLRLRWKHVA